ncbi:MAG: energy transducer TonB [Deltaproteobacteria bacterium]|nr:energy transducer TonB [Deltaproteobacteria bacterium]
MSIKTFPSKGNGGEKLLLFLMISVILHAGLFFGISVLTPLTKRLFVTPEETKPIVVDVIDLPPGGTTKAPPGKPSFYSDKNRIVSKETFPEAKPKLLYVQPPPSGKGGVEVKRSEPKGGGEAGDGLKKPSPATRQDTPLPGTHAEDTYAVKKADEPAKTDIKENTPKPGATGDPVGEGKRGNSNALPSKPNLFLTDERIAELTKKYESEAPKGERGKTLQLNTSELRYHKYLLNMKDSIQNKWDFPDVAARNGWQGKLRIDFTINKDGSVGDIKLIKSSNYPVLDDAAITALKLASPFPPFPDNFAIEEINIKGSFEYTILSQPSGRP